jgi:hypothetical protein
MDIYTDTFNVLGNFLIVRPTHVIDIGECLCPLLSQFQHQGIHGYINLVRCQIVEKEQSQLHPSYSSLSCAHE